MVMSDLPRDLVEEILSRVPATSLKRLRSTCKRWNTLFKKRRFTQKHFRKAPKESMVLMLKEYKVCSMNVKLNVSPPSVKFQDSLGLKDSHSNSEQVVGISEVFHCDGLLLCTTNDNNRLVVWNPCLGETKWIQSKAGYKLRSRFALGYENNKSCRSYKILRCWTCYDYKLDFPVLRFEIYDFSSDSWQVLDDVSPKNFPSINGVSIKGNTYWLKYLDDENDVILSFDFTTKRFKHFSFPPFLSHGCIALSVVGEEQLSVLQRIDDTSKIEIFVTKKVDNEADLLWSKSFTLELPIGDNCTCTDVLSSLLIDEEKKVALCCNLADKTSRNLVYTVGEDNEYYSEITYVESTNKPWWEGIGNTEESTTKPWWYPFIFNYVPSLVQIL